jgi:hypothetical protein
MAKRQPGNYLRTSERDGQVSAPGGMQSFFLRNIPLWNPPAWQEADYWRNFVERQSVAAICRDTLANYLNSLDWAIVARDTEERDELKPRIKHYTKLFERGNAYWWDLDFSSQIEWFVKDLTTLPFGTASELGRLDDDPKGRVVWIRPLDGGTVAPTLNFEFPVVQSYAGTGVNPIYFPREFISRVYLSPRTEIRREGWGYAPPERIWRAIEMLATGDTYYAQLLLDTPEAGIIDLGDMEKKSALDWIASLKDLLYGINPLKIPVLYEHTTEAKWIPFGRPPSEIMYDSVTMKYAAILTAGYGLTLSDVGFPSSSNGGETLAGTIRQERVSKSSGKAVVKKKWEVYANKILDPRLKWSWIDYDDERNVSKGRARLASAQSSDILIRNRVFTPSEIRRQNIADGLISIDVPEQIDLESPEFEAIIPVQNIGGSRGKSLGNPKNPSQGGQGETIPQQVIQRSAVQAEVGISKAIYNANDVLSTLINTVRSNLSDAELQVWEEYVDGYLVGKSGIEEEQLKGVLDDICKRANSVIATQPWVEDIAQAISTKVLETQASIEADKINYGLAEKAEEDFIAGKSDSLLPARVSVNLSQYEKDLHGVISENLSRLISGYAVLISKSALLAGELGVDATERVNENIRVSRKVSKEVWQNLSSIVNSVYEIGAQYISERTKENAES